jgi:hypothetical protein
MSILNLNTPQGRGPVGKKPMKLWMGVGLLAAVLGFGSTLAANIQINNDETSEFGQGVTQTVYCGGDQEVTIAPISAYVNTVETPTWRQPVFAGKTFRTVGSASFSALNTRSFSNSYTNDQTGELETTIGYWVKDRISTDYYTKSLEDILRRTGNPPTGDYDTFVPQEQKNGTYGFYYYSSWTPGFTADTTEDKFELGGIRISNIPSECESRDFIISAYGNGADPLKLSDDLDVTEITVAFFGEDSSPLLSFDRTPAGIPVSAGDKVTASNTSNSIKVLFTSAAGRLLADSVTKIVVETQEEALD